MSFSLCFTGFAIKWYPFPFFSPYQSYLPTIFNCSGWLYSIQFFTNIYATYWVFSKQIRSFMDVINNLNSHPIRFYKRERILLLKSSPKMLWSVECWLLCITVMLVQKQAVNSRYTQFHVFLAFCSFSSHMFLSLKSIFTALWYYLKYFVCFLLW